jgi:hypothetical protein
MIVMNELHLRMCAWSGVVAAVGILIGWVLLANWVPPTDPAAAAEDIAAFYNENTNQKRLGLLIAMTSTILLMPWMIATSHVLRYRMNFPVLADVNLATGIIGVVATFVMWMCWGMAAFRPERAPELILAFHDFGWINATWFFPEATLELIAISVAVLSYKGERPIYPRWYGYFLIFLAMLSVTAGLIIFFKDGPFAYNGLVSFWLVYGCLFLFFFLGSVLLIRGLGRYPAQDAALTPAARSMPGLAPGGAG